MLAGRQRCDLDHHIHLPPGTTKRDLAVIIRADRLTISLAWAGRVLDGPLFKPVRASDACWALDASPGGGSGSGGGGSESAGAAAGLLPPPQQWRGGAGEKAAVAGIQAAAAAGQVGAGGREKCVEIPEGFVDMMIVLPKAEGGRFWKALFEGGPEKSHWEVGPGAGFVWEGCVVFGPDAAHIV